MSDQNIISRAKFDKLTSKQKVALTLLMQGLSAVEVTKQLKIGSSTISRWRQIVLFRDCENELKQEALAEAQNNFHELGLKAVENLRGTLSSKNERIRWNATKYVLDRLDLPNLPEEEGPCFSDLERAVALLQEFHMEERKKTNGKT